MQLFVFAVVSSFLLKIKSNEAVSAFSENTDSKPWKIEFMEDNDDSGMKLGDFRRKLLQYETICYGDCDSGCDEDCNSSCDQNCNEDCDESCNTDCDSSCDLVIASCDSYVVCIVFLYVCVCVCVDCLLNLNK